MIRIWGADADTAAQGRIKGSRPIAVLDIGSNSVRLVVYERHARALTVLYNEKAASALGRGVASTGRIAEKNIAHALKAARRFALVARLMQVGVTHVLATSAVREAENGKDFSEQISQIMQAPVKVLSGTEEAHFAALGVVAGMPKFSGVVGDLGGGSLELSRVENGEDLEGETYELGVIRLQDDSDGSVVNAYELAKERLQVSALSAQGNFVSFCAIGGTWRSLAKLHQRQCNYPLHMIQHYRADANDMLELCHSVMKSFEEDGTYKHSNAMSSSRRGLVPFGAAVLAAALELGNFEDVVFSALGVREGFLFGELQTAEKQVDPLLQVCEEMSVLRARSPLHAEDLIGFTSQFMMAAGIEENVEDIRLRKAVCFLADIAWRGHPDYRGEQAVDLIAHGALVGIDHPGRIFLAQALAVRYMGLKHKSISAELFELLDEEADKRAKLLAVLLRVAYPLSASMAGVLPHVNFSRDNSVLQLHIPNDYAFLDGDRLDGRMKQLASAARLSGSRVLID